MAAHLDAAEVSALAHDLDAAAKAVTAKVRPVISRGALNIKRQMVTEMRSSPSFRGTASSITYDLTDGRGWVMALIGPDKDRGGSLANIAYFGSPSGGGATVPDPMLAAEDEWPNLEHFLGDVLEDLP